MEKLINKHTTRIKQSLLSILPSTKSRRSRIPNEFHFKLATEKEIEILEHDSSFKDKQSLIQSLAREVEDFNEKERIYNSE